MTAKAKTKAELIAELELLRQRCAALEAHEAELALENQGLVSENQRLAAAEQQRAGELALINAVQQGLASNQDLQVIYDLVGDKIRSIFDSQGVTIAWYRAETNWI